MPSIVRLCAMGFAASSAMRTAPSMLWPGRRGLSAARVSALSASPQVVSSFAEVEGLYDAFLLDQFGVVHDGKTAYEGSAELIRRLQTLGKRVVVLSNSSKRRRDTVERLHALQCGMCTYLDRADVVEGVPAISVFTSGDLVHDALRALMSPRDPSLFDGVLMRGANRVFCFGNDDDDESYLRSAELIPYVLLLRVYPYLGRRLRRRTFCLRADCSAWWAKLWSPWRFSATSPATRFWPWPLRGSCP